MGKSLFLLVEPLIVVTLLCCFLPENTAFSASYSESSNLTGISQIGRNSGSDDIQKGQILANSLEKRLKDIAAMLEITGNLSQVRSTSNASMLNFTLETLHGIPEDVDLEKRSIAQDIISNYDDVQVIIFLMPNGDVYLEQPYSRQQNLVSDNLSFRDYYRGAVDTNSTYLGNVIKSASSNQTEALIAVPLYSVSNKSLLGVWAGGIDFRILNEELQSLNLIDNERVVYVDGNGTKIADSDRKRALNTSESFSKLESFQDAMNGKFGSMKEEVSQTPMVVSYYPIEALQNKWAVLWMRPLSR
jgi:Cache domain